MRSNSGKGKSNNNNLDPTLKEHEAARGKSGEAIANAPDRNPPSRKSARSEQSGG